MSAPDFTPETAVAKLAAAEGAFRAALAERDALIRQMAADGQSRRAIAALFGINFARVHQIVKAGGA